MIRIGHGKMHMCLLFIDRSQLLVFMRYVQRSASWAASHEGLCAAESSKPVTLPPKTYKDSVTDLTPAKVPAKATA